MYEKYTDRARKLMQLASQEAQLLNHEYVGTEHVLMAFAKMSTCVALELLARLGVDPRQLRDETRRLLQPGPEMINIGKLPQTPRLKKALGYAEMFSKNMQDNHIGTEHIVLGLLQEEEGIASQVLKAAGLEIHALRQLVAAHNGHAAHVRAELTNQLRQLTITLEGDSGVGKTRLGLILQEFLHEQLGLDVGFDGYDDSEAHIKGLLSEPWVLRALPVINQCGRILIVEKHARAVDPEVQLLRFTADGDHAVYVKVNADQWLYLHFGDTPFAAGGEIVETLNIGPNHLSKLADHICNHAGSMYAKTPVDLPDLKLPAGAVVPNQEEEEEEEPSAGTTGQNTELRKEEHGRLAATFAAAISEEVMDTLAGARGLTGAAQRAKVRDLLRKQLQVILEQHGA